MPRRPGSRRSFLKASAAALAAPAFLSARGANERLNLAFVACGGRGGHNMRQLETENVAALCDVDAKAVDAAAAKHPKARKFADFRKVFDHAKEFDAVVVSTCEHTHALATLAALQLGKHVYCEKPLTHNIWEARVIREAAAKTKVATQMGNQNHSNNDFRRVVELVRGGVVGQIKEAHVWVSRAWGLQPAELAKKNENHKAFGPELHGLVGRPKDSVKPPADLDWDLWLGPAPERPFSPVYVPGPKWYRFWAFGNGTMSDLGSHWLDLPFWALNLKAPLAVEAFDPPAAGSAGAAKPGQANPEIAPATMRAVYEYGPRGDMPAVKLTWYQGDTKPDLWTDKKIPQWANGMLFVGEKGMILADYQKHVLLPEKEFADVKRPAASIPNSPGHWAEWVRACKTGEPTGSNFEYAGWLTEANHLGNVAYRAGKRLEWDADRMKAKNCPEADEFIRREYRKGWKLG
ncbi:MAG: oxidoreductase [Isosphaera sp.]|nr:oxidoreductase [Isosphaera sp.]